MSLTKEQQDLRRTRIGASEIGAVLGIDPFRTPLQLFMQKRMPHPARREDHREWGLDVEAAIIHNYARRNGYELLPPIGSLAHPTLPLVCTPDALGVRHGRMRDIQAKNVEEHHAREWGEPGTAEAPLFYVAQVTVEVGVLRSREGIGPTDLRPVEGVGDLAASFGGRPPLGYPIPFDAELFGNLAEAAQKFVHDHLETDKPPPLEGDRAATEYVKRRWRSATGALLPPTPQAAELVRKLREAKAHADTAGESADALQAQLCDLIGEALGFEGLCTWSVIKEQRKSLTDWPMVVEKLAHEAQFGRAFVEGIVREFTREEVTKESYRRLSLAKERKSTT